MIRTAHKIQDMTTETVHEFTPFSIPLLRSFSTVFLISCKMIFSENYHSSLTLFLKQQ